MVFPKTKTSVPERDEGQLRGTTQIEPAQLIPLVDDNGIIPDRPNAISTYCSEVNFIRGFVKIRTNHLLSWPTHRTTLSVIASATMLLD